MISIDCVDCGAKVKESDPLQGEIVSCPVCGLDYVVEELGGDLTLVELVLDGEDWGQ